MSLSIRDTLSPTLRKLTRGIDARPILEAVGLQLTSIAARSFNDESMRVVPWAALKPSTLRGKLKAGKSSAILKRNVVLARSWSITALTTKHVTVGTDRPYARFHQFGTRHIPARPMLPFTGSPDAPQLAPWARDKLTKIAQAKLNALRPPSP